ncbi:MAG: S8 family serine peptidase [Novosphingobium sp.]|nr:S8 family serine peptidase [Novosphingobium sp.]
MKRSILAASAGSIALAGLAWAAASSTGLVKSGPGTILLPSSSSTGASAPVVAATPAAAADGFQLAADGRHIVDAYICVFRAGAVARGSERAEANRSANAAGGRVGHVYGHALQGFSVNASARGVEMMQRNNARIDYCEQDQVMALVQPIEALAKPGGGGGTQPVQVTPPGITQVNGGIGGATGTAWVIDTGIDFGHPDLLIDEGRSRSFVTGETTGDDGNGHGTHVAGTIAGVDNTIGTVGVAAGATVVAVKVLNRRGSGTNSGVIAGVDYVKMVGQPGDVANMSLGGGVSTALDTAVVNASGTVKFAVAAGNDGGDANLHSPARANGPNIYTVAAFSPHTGLWASFSNWGKPPVDYANPGVSIFSTWLNGGYNTISGTSMATPHLAGVLLLGEVRNGGTVTRIAGDDYIKGVH